MLLIMSESVAMRMRELGMKCTVVEVSVRDSNLMGFVRQRKIEMPTNGALEIAKIAFELFKSNYRWGKPLRGVGVRGAGLVPEDCAMHRKKLCCFPPTLFLTWKRLRTRCS